MINGNARCRITIVVAVVTAVGIHRKRIEERLILGYKIGNGQECDIPVVQRQRNVIIVFVGGIRYGSKCRIDIICIVTSWMRSEMMVGVVEKCDQQGTDSFQEYRIGKDRCVIQISSIGRSWGIECLQRHGPVDGHDTREDCG